MDEWLQRNQQSVAFVVAVVLAWLSYVNSWHVLQLVASLVLLFFGFRFLARRVTTKVRAVTDEAVSQRTTHAQSGGTVIVSDQSTRPTMTPPTLEAFLARLSRLTSQEARQIAELPRVADWRVDADLQRRGPIGRWLVAAAQGEYAMAEMVDGMSDALSAAKRLIGEHAVADARARAGYILDQIGPTWPGMHLQRPLTLVAVGGFAAALAAMAVGILSGREDDVGPMIVAGVVAFTAGLTKIFLPPGAGNLRNVVELAAVAHAAGSNLSEQYFDELAGGWYAVLEGRWRRNRPWLAWGCFLTGVAVVIALAVLVPIAERALNIAP